MRVVTSIIGGFFSRIFRRKELSDVTIYIDGKETKYQVGQRVFHLIRIILDNADRISRPSKVDLALNCAGTSVDADIRERLQAKS